MKGRLITERRELGGQESQDSWGKTRVQVLLDSMGVEMDSSCQVSSLLGLILTQCAGDIFTDARVLGAEFGGGGE